MKIRIITESTLETPSEYRAAIILPWIRYPTRRMALAPTIIRKVAISTGAP